MKSMTDFIDSTSRYVDNSAYAVYSEAYVDSEKYAEFYDEQSSNYLGNVFESSGYQFFGEAVFYQEAHKGLIAGGILALFSGAFFMIMKLLKGDGGSSGSSASSHGSTKKDVAKRKAKDAEIKAKEADKQPLQHTPSENNDTKQKPEIPPSNQQTKQEPEKYTKPDDLEDEEKLVFNAKVIFKALDEFKKNNPDERYISINSSTFLSDITGGMSTIEDIVKYMVEIIKDGQWHLFGSVETAATKEFHEKCRKLEDSVKKIKSDSDKMGSNKPEAKTHNDIEISVVESFIREIDNLSKSIETYCKEGMRLCKEERKKRIENKKDVSNVDIAYKMLNQVIRDINYVCKNIHKEFETIYKSARGKEYKGLLILVNQSGFGSIDSDEYEDYITLITKQFGKGNVSSAIKNIIIPKEKIQHLIEPATINDKVIGEWNNGNKAKFEKRCENIINLTNSMLKKLNQEFPDMNVEGIRTFVNNEIDIARSIANTPVEDMIVDKPHVEKSIVIKVNDFLNNFDSNFDNLVSGFKNPTTSENKQNNNAKNVDEMVDEMSAISAKTFVNNLKDTNVLSQLKGLLKEIPNEIKHFATICDNAADELDSDDDYDEFVSKVHEAVKKYLYRSDTKVNYETWKTIEKVLDDLGYKSIEAKVDDRVSASKTYWDRPIQAKNPGDKEPGTIKQIQQMPRVMKIDIDGDEEILKLPGKCSYWGNR